MEQLKIEVQVQAKKYKPVQDPLCPCCKQRIRNIRSRYASWKQYRAWLETKWDQVAASLFKRHLETKTELSLDAHPDLLFALKAEAGYNRLELNDMLTQIVDSYMEGRFDLIERRTKGPALLRSEIDKASQGVTLEDESKSNSIRQKNQHQQDTP